MVTIKFNKKDNEISMTNPVEDDLVERNSRNIFLLSSKRKLQGIILVITIAVIIVGFSVIKHKLSTGNINSSTKRDGCPHNKIWNECGDTCHDFCVQMCSKLIGLCEPRCECPFGMVPSPVNTDLCVARAEACSDMITFTSPPIPLTTTAQRGFQVITVVF